jgi:hypothetical protein
MRAGLPGAEMESMQMLVVCLAAKFRESQRAREEGISVTLKSEPANLFSQKKKRMRVSRSGLNSEA